MFASQNARCSSGAMAEWMSDRLRIGVRMVVRQDHTTHVRSTARLKVNCKNVWQTVSQIE